MRFEDRVLHARLKLNVLSFFLMECEPHSVINNDLLTGIAYMLDEVRDLIEPMSDCGLISEWDPSIGPPEDPRANRFAVDTGKAVQ